MVHDDQLFTGFSTINVTPDGKRPRRMGPGCLLRRACRKPA